MNKINLHTYADEINQFLVEARLKNIDFDKNKNLRLGERGVARGVYDNDNTSSGSSDEGNTTTMNYNNQPAQEKTVDKSQLAEPPLKNTTPKETAAENSTPENNAPREKVSSLENLQIAYKKMLNLKKKFEAFKKQCENSELTVDDVINAANDSNNQQNGQHTA